NYSRHLSGRAPGEAPATLIDYFPENFITFVDESHVTLPQIGGMFKGDRSRKESLVEHGFRLPSALDNRPLFFKEFLQKTGHKIFVSATPGDYELKTAASEFELINRPTGLLDPWIDVRPSAGQMDDLISEINLTVKSGSRILVTTLTKKMAEDLTEYLLKNNIKVNYLHSDIETIERVEIIKALRAGDTDVLVGINLLREGLDIPEVALVAILDADKTGFLRSRRSLIQTAGRAARNVNGKVIMYADRYSNAMQECIRDTERKRRIQKAFNKKNNITPRSIKKEIDNILERTTPVKQAGFLKGTDIPRDRKKIKPLIKKLDLEMKLAADNLEFEKAIELREKIAALKKSLKL
ncbi:MAG TPA: helicase-related protein, partial [Spirochaetota bacterium]|nr:helicase-related protein [Spirochaetota bacterium]